MMTKGPVEPRFSRHASRVGKKIVSGYFAPIVPRTLKALALERDTTVQVLLAQAINDLFEKHGKQRLASEKTPPRGGAAHLAYREDNEPDSTD
jgi:hypothetical protein